MWGIRLSPCGCVEASEKRGGREGSRRASAMIPQIVMGSGRRSRCARPRENDGSCSSLSCEYLGDLRVWVTTPLCVHRVQWRIHNFKFGVKGGQDKARSIDHPPIATISSPKRVAERMNDGPSMFWAKLMRVLSLWAPRGGVISPVWVTGSMGRGLTEYGSASMWWCFFRIRRVISELGRSSPTETLASWSPRLWTSQRGRPLHNPGSWPGLQ